MLVIVVGLRLGDFGDPFLPSVLFYRRQRESRALSGIDVERLTLIAFVITGLLAGLAGVLAAARLNSAVVSAGIGRNST